MTDPAPHEPASGGQDADNRPMSLRTMLLLSIPAVLIGVGSAVVLWLLDLAAQWLQDVLWETLPGVFGATGETWWWIILMLTLVGLAIGLIVQFAPGHAGPDSATTELSGPPPKVVVVPSLAVTVIIGLAGGVSLGPENPIMAINAALSVALVARITTRIPLSLIVLLSSAATIGALFGTPVAGALIFPGMVAAVRGGGSLWDKLFLPLAAGGAGAVTMLLLGGDPIGFSLEPMGPFQPGYLLWGSLVAIAAALVVVLAAWVFPFVHRAFHALKHPVIFTTLGGLLLGVLGVLGTPETMFKGLEQAGTLLTHPEDYSAWQLALFAGVKAVALLVAASAGFRGGRIFPIVFIGVAFGLLANALFPGIPLSLAVACAVMGMTIAATRDGWIAIFVAMALVGDLPVLPLLCLIILPTWLVVTRAPELLIHRRAVDPRPEWA
ncbi:ion channel protein [Microbacterium sp. BWT-B31]|uniref:ion channel protein n=1 Tax=Microbacterium sp. BWT-B31 TaxID=3232072 RepID=UPI00352980A8